MFGPNPKDKYPIRTLSRVIFLKNFITQPNIFIGDYTYYDDPDNPEKFETKNVLYHYPVVGDKLIIGKFCAIAQGAKFMMNGANHKMSGLSTYPFSLFGNGWEKVLPKFEDLPYKGDTVVNNDVWLGCDCMIMPGVKIGNGAIIASRAVVTHDVEPYAIAGGVPARIIKKRFSDIVIAELERIQWWNWDIKKITDNLENIVGGDIGKLLSIRD